MDQTTNSAAAGTAANAKPRISYFDPSRVTDPAMRAEFERARTQGVPRPETHAMRAHVPAVFWSFANAWRDTFVEGVCEHAIKELCRLYVSQSVQCHYCGNQRSMQAFGAAGGAKAIVEDDVKDLLEFEKSVRFDARQKAALRLAEAITWGTDLDDAQWNELHARFSEPELVELGFFIGLTMGQQRFNRLLNLQHHQVLAGTGSGLAPAISDDALR
jgi:alkylhydroperoxidase family enzyme